MAPWKGGLSGRLQRKQLICWPMYFSLLAWYSNLLIKYDFDLLTKYSLAGWRSIISALQLADEVLGT